MRKVPVDCLVPGMCLSRAVLGISGEIYLAAGVTLTRRYIQKLADMGFYSIYIEDRLLDGVEVRDVISEKTRRDAIIEVRKVLVEVSMPGTKALNVPREITGIADNIVS